MHAPALLLRTCWYLSVSLSLSLCTGSHTHSKAYRVILSELWHFPVVSDGSLLPHLSPILPAKAPFLQHFAVYLAPPVAPHNHVKHPDQRDSSLACLLFRYTCFAIDRFMLSSCSCCILLEENSFGSFIFLVWKLEPVFNQLCQGKYRWTAGLTIAGPLRLSVIIVFLGFCFFHVLSSS